MWEYRVLHEPGGIDLADEYPYRIVEYFPDIPDSAPMWGGLALTATSLEELREMHQDMHGAWERLWPLSAETRSGP